MADCGETRMQMEEEGPNTTVFNLLKTFDTYAALYKEESSGEDSFLKNDSLPHPDSLQTQYEQKMKAEQIHSDTRLLQMEREKMQMELSHKRARIELEKTANLNANKLEREAECNQELLKRIKQCQERETEIKNTLQEQLEINKTCQENIEALNKKLQEKETKLAEANETISCLKGKVSESQWNTMNQETEMKKQQSQIQELTEQVDVLHKKWQEAIQRIQVLQAKEQLMSKKEQKIQDLEQKLSAQEQDAVIVKNMKRKLAQFPQMERELQQLREENTYLREMRENNGLLKEEVEGLQKKLERFEKIQAERVTLELQNKKLQEKLDQNTGRDIRSPDDVSQHIIGLQQRELILKEQNTAIANRARLLENARKQLQEKFLKVQNQLLEENKKCEQQEAMVKNLQKHVKLLTNACDRMNSIVQSYDMEMNQSERLLQLNVRVQEAEELVKKGEAYCKEMEGQLFEAYEEAGSQKKRANMLEAELQMLKGQMSAVEPSNFLAKEELDTLRLKIEELETERSQLEEKNKLLEAKLEQAMVQVGISV
ncbi:mitotic spindle assembly checkpoint protein MAD1 isoform X2 [Pseudonaja textilis]|uniref:mitotic spindle assembly checkpoint protein MAD1 isoform X2 n=1 Tax=Pseudonaja textilis TaxID=8673 RepID=UPI000EA87D9F|nr:mitotic spindle assembly checkpoint protein MAD1 isoform X2 [Pseudonaja textilis]